MAYNGYGSYTPYYQAQQPNSNDRNQYAPQNASAARTSAYQRQAYTNRNHSVGNQQQPQTAYGSSTEYTESDEPTTAYSSSYIQSMRGGGDTTALGNLAYASTLRRGNGDSVQGVADFHRQQERHGQGQNNGQNYQRSESRGSVVSRVTSSVNSSNVPAQTYTHQVAYDSGNYEKSYQSQASRHDVRRLSQHNSAPSRPASGQSMHESHSHRQITPSSQLHGYTPIEKRSTHQSFNSVAAAHISRPPSAQHLHSGIESSEGPSLPSRAAAVSPHIADNSHSHSHTTASAQRRSQSTQLPSSSNSRNTQAAEKLNGATPAIVDPNQVFNQYEYQKRQAAVAAEAEAVKRKAAEAEKLRKRTDALKQSQPVVNEKIINGINDEEIKKKEQMETEMKLLLEKMREYKSQDPALFSQLWEQVKKAQPPGSLKNATQTTTELPASKEVALPTSTIHVDTNSLQSSSMPEASDASLSSQQIGDEELPDRGKFPAARRRRLGRPSRGSRISLSTTHEPPKTTSASSGIASVSNGTVSEPIENAHAVPQTANSSTPDAPNSNSTQSAQKIWVSGKKSNDLLRKQTYQPALAPAPRPAPEAVMATPATTTQAPLRPSGQTVWPEADKWTLAVAARNSLMLSHVSAGKSISSSEIHAILNQGPSYEELCRILEGKGFVVDRTQFAQRLISAVPRLKDRQPASTTSSASTSVPSSNLQSSKKQMKGAASTNITPTAPMFGMLQPALVGWKPVVTASIAQQPSQTYSSPFQSLPAPPPQPPPRPPAATVNGNVASVMQQPAHEPSTISKAKAARKRDFSEIVDLTVEMSSDEELNRQRVKEMKKLEQLKHMQQVKATMDASISTKVTEPVSGRTTSTSKSKRIRFSPEVEVSSSALSDDDGSGLARFRNNNVTTERERLRKFSDIVKPLQRTDAMRRSTYNSKTIARDILVTAGKHPTMSALNYHLDPLRSHFRHVEYSSNLSTFKWDLVDPGGPPVKPRHAEPMNQPISEAEDADDEFDESVDTRAWPNQRHQGQVAVSDNKTQDVVMVDATPPALKGSPRMSGRGRGRGRGLRPSRGGMRSRAAVGSPGQQPNHSLAQTLGSSNSGDISMLSAGVPTSAVVFTVSTPSSNHQSAIRSGQAASARTSEKKRRSKSTKNDNHALTTTEFELNASTPIPVSKLSSFRSHSKASSKSTKTLAMPDAKVTKSANERTATTPARPSGLRNQLLTSPFAVVIPQRSPTVESGSGRITQSKKVKKPSPPKYQIYKCRWKGCEGRLHNLETLRKHVRKHMEEFDEDLQCLWEGCGTTKVRSSSSESNSHQPLEFKSETAWERHMEGRHLDRYAWKLGDGPSTHASDAEAYDYLSDSQKRQVTPIASPHNPRSDTFNLATIPRSERAKVAKAFHGAHANKTEAQKAQAVFDNLLERRRKLGPGIERAGHQFVTDEKRALLEAGPEQLRKMDSTDL